MTINEIIEEASSNAEEKGFYDAPQPFPGVIALMHSELSEALEEHRDGNEPKDIYYRISKETGGDTYPCGIPIELADVVIRICDTCGFYGIDLDKAIRIKMDYNKGRPHKHGKEY